MNDVERLVEDHIDIARSLATMYARKSQSFMCLIEELHSEALYGLYQAAVGYKVECGSAFTSYAYLRVRGALVDFTRKWFHVSREYKTCPSLVSWDVLAQEATSEELNSYAACLPTNPPASWQAEANEELRQLDSRFMKLPVWLRKITLLYCKGEANHREIAEWMGVSESRVCQMVTEALHIVRTDATYNTTGRRQERILPDWKAA